MALIIRQADVSASTFQNIFRNKEGVLMELTQTMFEKQFSMASGVMGEAMPPVYLYAAETAIQLTLAELNENLREIYVEAYTRSSVAEYICENTAKVLYQVFGSYLPECTPEEFYEMDIGTSGLMRGEYPKLVNKQQVKTIIGVLNGAIVTEWLEGLPTYQVGKRYRWKIEDVARRAKNRRFGRDEDGLYGYRYDREAKES